MSPAERQKWLLGGLLIVLAFGAWQWLSPILFDPTATRARQQRETRQKTLAGAQVVDVRLDALDVEPRDYEPSRNIFDYGRAPAPPPLPPPPPPPPRPQVTTQPPPPPPPVRRPPPLDVNVIGVFGPERRRIAVLRDGQKIVNALEGETVKDKFIIHQIGYETVDFKFVGFPDVEPQRLKIGGK